MIPFTDWRPDIANLNGNFTALARNVLPGATSYRPMPSLSAYQTTALPSSACGLSMGRQTAGAWSIYGGTATKLYFFATNTWTDVSRLTGGNYNVDPSEFWRFAQFGTQIIAVNSNDDPQTINVDSGANFSALAGSPPRARNISVVGDFVVLSSLTSDLSAIRWSAINNPFGWTIGNGLSDYQSFGDGGRVTGVAGGEVGYVMQEYAIRRMRFLPGSDYVFSFEKVVDGKGCLSPYGYTTIGGYVYFVSEDGVYRYSGAGLEPIGAERVNRWFLNECDTTRLTSVYAVTDPYRPRIIWAFYSNPNRTSFDRVLVYDWQLDKFTYGVIEAQIWASAATPGITLDSITSSIDLYPISLDSRSLEGGRPTFSAINTSGQLCFMEGTNLEAVVETQEFEGTPNARSYIGHVEPIVDSASTTVRIGARERFANTVAYGSVTPMSSDGKCYATSSGRLHRVEVTIPSGSVWNHAIGAKVDTQPDGGI